MDQPLLPPASPDPRPIKPFVPHEHPSLREHLATAVLNFDASISWSNWATVMATVLTVAGAGAAIAFWWTTFIAWAPQLLIGFVVLFLLTISGTKKREARLIADAKRFALQSVEEYKTETDGEYKKSLEAFTGEVAAATLEAFLQRQDIALTDSEFSFSCSFNVVTTMYVPRKFSVRFLRGSLVFTDALNPSTPIDFGPVDPWNEFFDLGEVGKSHRMRVISRDSAKAAVSALAGSTARVFLTLGVEVALDDDSPPFKREDMEITSLAVVRDLRSKP